MRIPTLPTFLEAQQLDGYHYVFWKIAMEAVLETYELDAFTLGGASCPNLETHNATFVQTWDQKNAWVRSFIVLNC